MRIRRIAMLIFLLGLTTACAEVRPWERGYLARDEMAWNSDALERQLNDHIFFSKEASSGGSSAAGGGCGCN